MSARWKEPLGEFLCGFFMVAIGFPMQIGWAFVAYAGMSNTTLIQLSAALGVMAGLYFAWECARQPLRKEPV